MGMGVGDGGWRGGLIKLAYLSVVGAGKVLAVSGLSQFFGGRSLVRL